jgi:hypothetical protein
MATPTDEQRLRGDLRRAERTQGTEMAARMAIVQAVDVLGRAAVVMAAANELGGGVIEPPGSVPPLMGTAEVAATFVNPRTGKAIANSNISKLADDVRPVPVTKISGGTVPVYLASEVEAKAAAWRERWASS